MLQHLAGRVWLFPSDPDPGAVQGGVGVVVGDGGSTIVDAGHSPGLAPLEADARRPWSHAYLRDQVAANPLLGPSFRARALAVDFASLVVRPPTRTFASSLSVDGVEVRHVGGHHAPDSTVVAVPDSSVLLLGDCYYPPPWHLRTPEDGMDTAQLRGLVDQGYDWYVTSHQPPWRGTEPPDLE